MGQRETDIRHRFLAMGPWETDIGHRFLAIRQWETEIGHGFLATDYGKPTCDTSSWLLDCGK
jgi:hypothetical protein